MNLLAAVLAFATPGLQHIEPLGAMRGATVDVEVTGENLAGTTSVWFDNEDLHWTTTAPAEPKKLKGRIAVSSTAALGPHLFHLKGKDGRSNSRLFNVTQFPGVMEVEPNDTVQKAQPIQLKPQVIYGYMKGLADIDMYSFTAHAGERWVFDLRSLEYGGFLEASLALLDEHGREVAFNDDKDDYLETPLLEHTFKRDGSYRLKLDQYRGPQGVDCGQNCGYLLHISQLPVLRSAAPLGAQAGTKLNLRIQGSSLASTEAVYLTAARAGEYYRLTFPFSMPLRVEPDVNGAKVPRIAGHLVHKSAQQLEARFAIPKDARQGLWRLWVAGPAGIAEGVSLDIGAAPEYDESFANKADWRNGEIVINGNLTRAAEEDSYTVQLEAGKPFHAWTLAAQLGLPYIDTVLELFDANGKLVAEHDDLMTGQGTVIGNPDSSLYYTPKESGTLRLVVRDRTGRGGPSFAYRLKMKSEKPGFQLLTDPEEFNIARGGEGELEALLIRQPGFNEAVDVWLEGLPAGVEAPKGRFRADQEFGPSGDGDNVNIPDVPLKIRLPAAVAPGEYPFRILARATSGGPIVEGFATLWIGPVRKRNDVRRPLPAVTMTVVEPAVSK